MKELLNKAGNINSRLLPKYMGEILEKTKHLDYMDPSPSSRAKYLLFPPLVSKCSCGKDLAFSPNKGEVFKSSCGNMSCAAKAVVNKSKPVLNRNASRKYSQKEVAEFTKKRISSGVKPNYFTAISSDITFFIREESSRINIKATEYCYRSLHQEESYSCECGALSQFESFNAGYKKYCASCSPDGNTKENNSVQRLKDEFSATSFKVVETQSINKGPWKIHCPDCGTIFDKMVNNGFTPKNYICRVCVPTSKSQMEFELVSEISELYQGEIIHGFRLENTFNRSSYKSVDIYFPKFKLAIELNGIYWHSGEPQKHLEKLKKCEELGITLIQFTDIDWSTNKDLVISMISSRLGLSKRIYARKCETKEISPELYRNFCNDNHIKGYAPARIKLGMFYNDELVSVFSLSPSRFEKDEMECIRFCTKKFHTVVGGLGKFLSKIDFPFITYCDLHYGNGRSYQAVGMELIGSTIPNYFYWKSNSYKLEPRSKYQKHKLKKVLPDIYDDSKTEKQMMEEAGYLRYYDCGNKKFKYCP